MEYLISARHCVECFTDIISFNPHSNTKERGTSFAFGEMRQLKLRKVKHLSTYKKKKQNSRPAPSASKVSTLNHAKPLFCVGGIGDVDTIKDYDQRAGGHRDKQDECQGTNKRHT